MTLSYINNPNFKDDNVEIKSTYNKWLQRQFGKRLPIHIFGSGSEGNSIYLKPYKTLIDLGLPFKRYNEHSPTFFLDVDYIILTHHHGDHLNPSTLNRILTNYPHIRVIITEHMWDIITSSEYKPEYIKRDKGEQVPFGHDTLYKTDESGARIQKPPRWKPIFEKHRSRIEFATQRMITTHTRKEFMFNPLTTKHGDIVNIAIEISDPELDFEFLYASDLDNLGGERTFTDQNGNPQRITGLNQEKLYTCMFLEANYDEEILQNWYSKLNPDDPEYAGKKARADGNLRHISEQEASRYIEKHLVEDGLFIPLHASKTFGTLYQS